MAYERRSFEGGAVSTTLDGSISAASASITIADVTGWPDGSNGDFYIVIDPDTAAEEKVRCASRTGTSLSVAVSGRGADGSSAATHASGGIVKHVFVALDADEANYTVGETVGKVTTAGDLLVADGANSLARLAKGANSRVLGVDSGGTLGYTTVTAAMSAADLATQAELDAHTGDTSDAHDASAISFSAVGTIAATDAQTAIAEVATDAATALTTHLDDAADAHDASAVSFSPTGTIEATDVQAAVAEVSGDVTALGVWDDYTPTLTQSGAVTKTVTVARYTQIGDFVMATVTLTITGSGTTNNGIAVGLPVEAKADGVSTIGTAQIFDASGSTHYVGICRLISSTTLDMMQNGTSSGGMGVVPNFALANNDVIRIQFSYEAA